jgi:hypothetical protein
MREAELIQRISELEVQNRALIAENGRLRDALGLPPKEGITPEVAQGSLVSEESVNQTAKILPDHSASNKPLNGTTNISPNSPTSITPVNESAANPYDREINEILAILPLISKNSSSEEKIELFMSLFRGRTDVYAKRCYSRKHESAYYIPACKNDWVRGVCDRARTKCRGCTRRELLPLAKDVIDAHLRNRDEHGAGIVGIYPLLPDETCLFLAVDFDEANWQKDVTAFRTVCRESSVPVAIERSRSGNGAHAWMFFEEPVPAVSARRFRNVLLTRAMAARHEIRFASYDRMFPNQGLMPKGGFGNLIAEHFCSVCSRAMCLRLRINV